jgi:hypothetical protein
MTTTNQDRLCADRKERDMKDEKRAADDAERMERILAAFAYLNPDHPTVLAALEEIRQLQDAALSARADGGKGEAVGTVSREAQPIGKVSKSGNVVWLSTPQPGFIYAAPTPERADADTAGAKSITAEEFERWRIASKEHRDGLLANFPKEKPISDAMMDLVDRLGSEASEVDPRAWKHLLVYAPERADAEREPK